MCRRRPSGPGQAQIFMRGLSVGGHGTQSGGSINGFPNVAIYLDDQSGQLPGRNLDVYTADLERVEVLEGPQGTLFGAGAQAGVIRYITNKPKMNVTEGNVTPAYGVTAGGDPNTDLVAVLNLPLIRGQARGAGRDLQRPARRLHQQRAGYVHPKGQRSGNPLCQLSGRVWCLPAAPCQVPPGAPVINNAALTGNAINPVTYTGTRVSALWDFNDDWNALITQSYQNIDAQGVFYQMPNSSDGAPLPQQSVTLFNAQLQQGQVRKYGLDLQWSIRRSQGGLHRRRIWCAMSTRYRTTRTMRAGCMRTTTSATAPSRRTAWLQPAIRRAPPGPRSSATRIRVTNFASAPR